MHLCVTSLHLATIIVVNRIRIDSIWGGGEQNVQYLSASPTVTGLFLVCLSIRSMDICNTSIQWL